MATAHWFTALPVLTLLVACTITDGSSGGPAGGAGSTASTAGSTGQAGNTPTAGANAAAGTTGAGGSGGSGGTAATAGAAGTVSAGGMSAAGSSGAGGMSGGGASGAANLPSGKSAGCTKLPAPDDSQSKFVLKEIHLTGTFDPIYLAGGAIYKDNNLPRGGKYDFQFRPYSVRLPKDYDPTKAYPVVLAGGGCGGNAENFASNPGGGYQPDNTNSTIQVGLQYLAGCFADGGRIFADNMRNDTPEVPYVRQVIEEVENNYCVDKSLVFESGTSSGGWESFTTGCGAADLIRAIGPVSGGLRLHRPECAGPQAAIMVEGLQDGANPIGPIVPADANLDSPGSAPARDEILKRNGCVAPDYAFDYSDTTKKQGSAPHEPWDPAYPSCVKSTGCPAAYPVVWCALDCGHQCDNETINGTKYNYKDGIWKFFSSLPAR
jgi:poly(3-hydroxybutyrate) depolymerase